MVLNVLELAPVEILECNKVFVGGLCCNSRAHNLEFQQVGKRVYGEQSHLANTSEVKMLTSKVNNEGGTRVQRWTRASKLREEQRA